MIVNSSAKLQQTIFSDGSKFFESLITDLNAATETIDLETYIYNIDGLGEKIAQTLIAAAKRGVKVRLLVDGAGTPLWDGNFTKKLDHAKVQTRIFHPFPWHLLQLSRSVVRKPALLKMIYLFLKINSRNHRKVCIIDKKIAYIGSFNISKVHLSRADEGDNWRDTGVRLTGTDLKELTKAFAAAWDHMPIQERIHQMFRQRDLEPIIRLNNTRHRRRRLYKNLLYRIKHCKKRIWMTNAYFVPDNFLLKRLTDAAKKGIDVRVVLPQKSDIPFMPLASSTFYQGLLEAGVRIFEYLPSMLHTKILILDNWILVGSSNLNHRSVLHDLEVDVNIRVPAAKQAILQQFLEDIKQSQEIKLSDWQPRPFLQRLFGRLLLYIKYWI